MIEAEIFDVTVCRTFKQRLMGLIGQPVIDQRVALWFDRCRCVHTFAMRVSITLIFVDPEFKPVLIVPCAKPNRVFGCARARGVIELAWRERLDVSAAIDAVRVASDRLRTLKNLPIGGVEARVQDATEHDIERQL